MKIICYLFIPILLIYQPIQAQQTVIVDGVKFSSCETIKAAVSDNYFSVDISEYDMREFVFEQLPQLNKQAMVLSIEVIDYQNIPFPIRPEDNIVIKLSDIQQSLSEANYQKQQDSQRKTDADQFAEEGNALNKQKVNVESQARLIAQKVSNGEITPEEAAAKLEALSKEMMESAESPSVMTSESEQHEENPHYAISFYNLKKLEETRLVNGELQIIRFNENEFVAQFNGRSYTQCLERRLASDAENAAVCTQLSSSLVPETKVLREEMISGTVNIKLKQFENNRQ